MNEYRGPKFLPFLMLMVGFVFIAETVYSNWIHPLSITANAIQIAVVFVCFVVAVYFQIYVVHVDDVGLTVKSWMTTNYRFSNVKSIESGVGTGQLWARILMLDGTDVSFGSATLPKFRALISEIRNGTSIPKKVWEPV